MSSKARVKLEPVQLARALEVIRQQTLEIARSTPADSRSRQWHPSLSPVQWHLGHIGVVEDFWIRQHCWKESDRHPSYSVLFDPMRTPKWSRQTLPSLTDVLDFLQEVREPILRWLNDLNAFPENESFLSRGWIVAMVLQHECQHQETMQMVRYLMPDVDAHDLSHSGSIADSAAADSAALSTRQDFVRVSAGEFLLGSDDLVWSLDNERTSHCVRVEEFAIACYPVSNADYLAWMESGGYERRDDWSESGWIWKNNQCVSSPMHWRQRDGKWQQRSLSGWGDLILDRPVMGVSWYEADAYARSQGYRLPTESEWERAAFLDSDDWDGVECLQDRGDRFDEFTPGETKGVLEQSGCVWEWTSTPFAPYPGFRPFPYREYSEPWFDGNHYSLRGGSWATHPLLRRPTFRNWYEPQVREIFAGIRCAKEIHG